MAVKTAQQFVLNYLELILTGAGIAVIVAVPPLLLPLVGDLWCATALTAIAVGALHGCIFWVVRRRQRRVRAQAIVQVRAMLHDQIKNPLSVIALNAELSRAQAKHLSRIQTSVQEINGVLDHLSDDSLRHWQAHYGVADEVEPRRLAMGERVSGLAAD